MLITEANGFVSEVHDRMPVILEPDQFEPWLFCEAGIETLKPAANDVLHRRPVSKRVNSSRTPDDDILINRIELPNIPPNRVSPPDLVEMVPKLEGRS
jgi:putative SOS response-associated peptidase YedK